MFTVDWKTISLCPNFSITCIAHSKPSASACSGDLVRVYRPLLQTTLKSHHPLTQSQVQKCLFHLSRMSSRSVSLRRNSCVRYLNSHINFHTHWAILQNSASILFANRKDIIPTILLMIFFVTPIRQTYVLFNKTLILILY